MALLCLQFTVKPWKWPPKHISVSSVFYRLHWGDFTEGDSLVSADEINCFEGHRGGGRQGAARGARGSLMERDRDLYSDYLFLSQTKNLAKKYARFRCGNSKTDHFVQIVFSTSALYLHDPVELTFKKQLYLLHYSLSCIHSVHYSSVNITWTSLLDISHRCLLSSNDAWARLLQTCLPRISLFLPRCPNNTSIIITFRTSHATVFPCFCPPTNVSVPPTPYRPTHSIFISPTLFHYRFSFEFPCPNYIFSGG